MILPTVITAPIIEAVDLLELKKHLRVDTEDLDEMNALERVNRAARQYFEWRTGRTVHQTTWEIALNDWPSCNYICLPRATPLVSITSLKYLDSAGTEATWAASNYIADTYQTPGRVVMTYNNVWPSTTLYPASPIRIRYVAGIATASPITEAAEDIKVPILLIVGALWENREAEVLVADMRAIQTIEPKAAKWYMDRQMVEYAF